MEYQLKDLTEEEMSGIRVRTLKSSPYYHKNKALEGVVAYVKSIHPSKNDAASRWFVTNVSKVLRNKGKAMTVKLDTSYWTNNICGIGIRGVRALLNTLSEGGYIDLYIGYTEYWKPKTSRKSFPSVVVFKDKLLALFQDMPLHLFVKRGILEEEIVLRDRKTKEKKSTRVIRNVREERERMKDYNVSLAEADIKYAGETIATVEYFRSFTGPEEGGRLYVHGGGVQLVPEKYRSKWLTFNDEPVVELDYSSNHPNILYEKFEATTGFDLDQYLEEDFKPYGAEVDFLEVDEVAIEKHKIKHSLSSYDPVRELCKVALLVSINSTDRDSANQGLRNEIYQDRYHTKEENKKFVGLPNTINTDLLCHTIRNHNYLIGDYFFTDYGVTLQYIDSQIALRVVDTMIQNGETVLCYHDSFIVRKGAEDILRAAMHEAWRHILGNDKYCKVDKK